MNFFAYGALGIKIEEISEGIFAKYSKHFLKRAYFRALLVIAHSVKIMSTNLRVEHIYI